MTTQNLALFKGMTAKMEYLNHRQSVISQNIANADTPGYQPRDLTPVSFDQVLKAVDKKSGLASTSVAQTSAGHMSPGSQARTDMKEQKAVYEVAPAGNAVVLEEQMINSQKTVMDYNLMTSLYQKNVGMIMTSLGQK
jgi:flagellar basal-body rod protein FlgB